ncbi:MAG: TrkH family potassium uptake protein [Bacilli bacterium]|nr:TrkH family potassium uptake protein [Bacilli bacterium]
MNSKARSIYSYIGIFMMIIGSIIIIPIVTVLFFPEESEQIKYFALPGILTIFIGYILLYFNKEYHNAIKFDRNSLWLIVLIWLMAIVIASFPIALLNNYSFTQAIFESASGLSTTGLSVMDVSVTPKIFLLYRSELQFFGGVGLVLVFVSILSKQNTYAIYAAEGHDDQLSPNLVKSARRIIGIYFIYITIGTIFLAVFGMSIFDAINHSIAAISTGGFSTKVDSIYHYQSLMIEIIIIVLMLLGGTNFLIHHYIITGKFNKVRKHSELKYIIVVILIFVPLFALIVSKFQNMSYVSSFRITLFQFVSAATTTGFSSVPTFAVFSSIFLLMMILLMIIGGGIGSTAGGIKQFRTILILKSIFWYFRDSVSSKRLVYKKTVYKINKREEISDKMINSTYVFVLIYFSFLFLGALIFVGHGYTLEQSLFETASALGTVGLSVGLFTYYSPNIILWMGSILMFIGRLEILIVMISIVNVINKFRK